MGVIERWRDRLPVGPSTPELTLGEGDTPLLAAPRLSERLGIELHLKCEGLNPTGSFKDRGMVVAVAKAVEARATGIVCASTGNTAASAAAYAARAGLEAVILHPAGAIAEAKQAQARIVGARVVAVRGTFEDAFRIATETASTGSHVLVNSINPHRLAGQKTAAFEICEQLGRAPDVLALPYGGGGNVSAYAMGFAEAAQGEPLFVAAQSSERATTLASAIRIVAPAHVANVARIGAQVVSVSDDEIVEAWSELARLEGVFCEPSSAAGLAGVKQLRPAGTVVCVLTGTGLKDVAAVDAAAAPVTEGVEAVA